MATSKDQLFEKIDNLLIDINSKYLELKSVDEVDPVELTLLSGSIDYLSYHIKALKYLKTEEETEEVRPSIPAGGYQQEVQETIFTPKTDFEEKAADTQSTFDEIEDVTPEATEPEVKQEPVQEEKVPQQPESVQEVKNADAKAVYQQPAVEEPKTEEVVSVVVEAEKTVVIKEPAYVPKDEPTLEEVASTIEQRIEQQSPSRPLSINELIHQQKLAGKNLTQQFKTSSSGGERISDIKTAINLNDKLLFIKDLFNGYSLAYSEAIELLNRFDNFAEADAFLQTNYALKNGWSEKPHTVEKLYAILRKRFG
ncbi:MAG TPA: hypothetical protein PKA53_08115 [Sphingobacterium sp.]|nr:hypothetical protein [Sphingobacterium sp.]